MAFAVGTWRFCAPGIQAASALLQGGSSALDAVEAGVRTVELDTSVTSAGEGGLPNAYGHLQLDAALMTGCGRVGAVMALEGHAAAIPVARAVLEKSAHVQIVGDGAAAFAEEHGIASVTDPHALLTPHAGRRFVEWRNSGSVPVHADTRKHSDTVGVLARDSDGHIAAGVATSGMQFKTPGRVGDSPIVGAGLFAENGAGAAVATGDGDRMVRHCIAVRVVDSMSAGMPPEAACEKVLRKVAECDSVCQAAVVAMAADGTVGAASTHGGFHFVMWRAGGENKTRHEESLNSAIEVKTVTVDGISEENWVHSCV